MVRRTFSLGKIFGRWPGLQEWLSNARAQTEALCAMLPESRTFMPEVYQETKEYLVRYFKGRCAYCDSDFEAVSWGDVEHYRPKRRVDHEAGHPGYYWLAYEPTNLLPSCEKCNRGKGKRNQFPVAGARAVDPADALKLERPLLLNPYRDRPLAHLEYIFSEGATGLEGTGAIRPKTRKGETSIRVYGLNRSPLVRMRREVQDDLLTALHLAAAQRPPDFTRVAAKLDKAYEAARHATVDTWASFMRREIVARARTLTGRRR